MTARVLRTITVALAVLGVTTTALLGVGFARDITAFDTTSGGYQPPYTGFTGAPIDWTKLDVTRTGMVRRGAVVDILVDCSTGMITFETFGLSLPFREVSARAHAVHNPRGACAERGFQPAF